MKNPRKTANKEMQNKQKTKWTSGTKGNIKRKTKAGKASWTKPSYQGLKCICGHKVIDCFAIYDFEIVLSHFYYYLGILNKKVGRRASASSHRYQKFCCVLAPGRNEYYPAVARSASRNSRVAGPPA